MKHLERIIVGTALVVGSSVLLPIAKETLSTAFQVGGRAMTGIRTGLQLIREEVEDIVAEAQFERMKNQIDQEMPK
jgi:hypothetical protein